MHSEGTEETSRKSPGYLDTRRMEFYIKKTGIY
jgi:hypothetical protein